MKTIKKDLVKIEFGSTNYSDLSGFTEVSAASGSKGELGIISTDCGKRVRFSKDLFSALDEPESVKLLVSESKVAFKSVKAGTPGAYELGKGAVIYATDLAERIMQVASKVEFKANATTRCGHIEQVQTGEDGSTIVILNFE